MNENRRLTDNADESSPDGEAQQTLSDEGSDEVPDPGPNESAEHAESSVSVDRVAMQRDEYLEMLQRLQAEFENYRKRTVRQQTDLLQRASEGLIEQLLPVLDALDLALAHAEIDDANADQMKAALVQIDALMRKILSHEGLERIDASGVPFDPAIHDAVAYVPVGPVEAEEDVDAEKKRTDHGRVSEVLRAGYRLHGRVVRPAMVKVEG
jgi:molecular chaperone GrpE